MRALSCLILLIALGNPLRADALRGRLFLGRNLEIYIEEDESMLVRFLRKLSMVRRGLPIYPLRSRCKGGFEVFVGDDHGVYCNDPDGSGYLRIGEAADPSRIALAPGVELKLVTEVLSPFTEVDSAMKLKVDAGSDPIHVDRVARADLAFWLADLGPRFEEEGTPALDQAKPRELYETIVDSLPAEPGGDAASSALFHQLETHMDTAPLKYPRLTEKLLQDVLVRARASEGDKTAKAEIVARYQGMLAKVKKPGEG